MKTEAGLLRGAALVSVAAAMLAPAEQRVAGLPLFDLFAYGVVSAFALQAVFRASRFGLRRPGLIPLGWIALLVVTVAAHFVNSEGFRRQRVFLSTLGMNSEGLYSRLSLYGMATLFLFLGAFLIGQRVGASSVGRRQVVAVVLGAGAVNAGVSLIAWYLATGGSFGRYNWLPPIEASQGPHVDRMMLTFIVALGLWLRVERRRWSLIVPMTLALGSTATVFVRQGWATFALGVLLAVAITWRAATTRVRVRAALFAVFVLGSAGYVVTAAYRSELSDYVGNALSMESDDVLGRVVLVSQALQVFMEHPVVGVGYGHYSAYSEAPVFITGVGEYVASAHNGVGNMLAEGGALGVVCFLVLAMGLFRLVSRSIALHGVGDDPGLATGVAVLIVLALVTHTISNGMLAPPPLERSLTQTAFLFWLLVGLVGPIEGIGASARACHKDTEVGARSVRSATSVAPHLSGISRKEC